MAGMRIRAVLMLAIFVLPATSSRAENTDATLDFLLTTPDVLLKKDELNTLQEARLNSGLGLKFSNDLLQFNFDYKALVRARDKATEAEFSQQVGTSIQSNALNRALGLNAKIRTGSTIREAGDAYNYSVTPGISKTFSKLAKLDVQYQYLLSKANADAAKKEKSGYRMGLSGKAGEGRLSWKGNYRSTDEFSGAWQLKNTELLELESHFQLARDFRLVLSGRSADETVFDAGLARDILNETRYGVGLDWSPSQYYNMAVKLNKRYESGAGPEEFFGSGSFSWFPSNDMEFTLSYGDHLVKGGRGLMLNTRIDLSGS